MEVKNRLIILCVHLCELKVKGLPKALLVVEFKQVQVVLEPFGGMKEFNSKEVLYELWETQNPITLFFLWMKEK